MNTLKKMGRLLRYTLFLSVCISVIIVFHYCTANQDKPLVLNEVEQKWLEEHDEIVFAVDDTYPPLNYKDDKGRLVGLNIDLIRLIGQRTGIKIKLEGSTWNEALEKAMNHTVDGLINASPLEERKQRLNFTNSFFRDPLALVTYKDNDITAFDNIKFQRIAAKKGSQHLQALSSKIPNHLIISISTLEEGIELLSAKKIDGIYDDLAPLYHLISSQGYSHLKIAFVEPSKNGARIAVRNDDEIMLRILNKAIKSISNEDRLAIQNKWLKFTPERDYAMYYLTIAVLLTIVLLISLWTWSLKLMVNKRTNELKEELIRRKETEKLLISAKEKAEESDRLKSAFVANISHEIRTPMNGIVGFSELLTESEFIKEEQDKYHGLILSSARQLLSIINDLVNISKLEANLVQVYKAEVDINKMLQDLYSVFSIQVANKDISLECTNIENKENTYLLDEVKVVQVLTNLISNAIKNTEAGYVKFGIHEMNETELTFFVKDSGIGIKPENHKNIFNRFWKENNGANYGGTGLGLAISKAHIELMGGKIWLNSSENNGAEFYFALPFS